MVALTLSALRLDWPLTEDRAAIRRRELRVLMLGVWMADGQLKNRILGRAPARWHVGTSEGALAILHNRRHAFHRQYLATLGSSVRGASSRLHDKSARPHVWHDDGMGDIRTVLSSDASEIQSGERFAFGNNWAKFLDLVDDERIQAAEQSLRQHLGDIARLRFVDVGSGSGLFSLAARNLGAEVLSFDYDVESVGCTEELRRRYHPDDPAWAVQHGSALDGRYLETLGRFDVVYSWGVLHHTGDMWTALGNVDTLVRPGGQLFISIYNDQGRTSRNWRRVKRAYNRSGSTGRRAILTGAALHFRLAELDLAGAAYRTVKRLPSPRSATTRVRGMDRHRDLVDWVGGWPFEVAKPEAIFDFYRDRGYELLQLQTCAGGIGCNEFVFHKRSDSADHGGDSHEQGASPAASPGGALKAPHQIDESQCAE
ncbi:MAG: class I SAM-dependent methyltransferase [Mycobacteriaceae bacterium]